MMNIKLIKAACAGITLTICSFANAGIIDNGSYTTVDGLDWLDWTLTQSETQSTALAANIGWRTATLIEMESMMNTMFSTTFTWDVSGIDVGLGAVAGVQNYKATFLQLFGATGNQYTYASAEGVGLVGFGDYAYAAVGRPGGGDHPFDDINFASSFSGVALVRSSISVPEPSTLAIFALGMIGLASHRFKKQS
jgi:hypothetical protein